MLCKLLGEKYINNLYSEQGPEFFQSYLLTQQWKNGNLLVSWSELRPVPHVVIDVWYCKCGQNPLLRKSLDLGENLGIGFFSLWSCCQISIYIFMLISMDLYCFMYMFVYVQCMYNYRYIHRSINFDSIPHYFSSKNNSTSNFKKTYFNKRLYKNWTHSKGCANILD